MNKLLGNTESVGMKKNTSNLRNFLVELNRNNLKKNEITVLKKMSLCLFSPTFLLIYVTIRYSVLFIKFCFQLEHIRVQGCTHEFSSHRAKERAYDTLGLELQMIMR